MSNSDVNKNSTTHLIIEIMAVFMIMAVTISIIVKFNRRQPKFNSQRSELNELFAKYNESYENKVKNEDKAKVLILEADDEYTKKANKAIINYLTNVGGKLISINGKDFKVNEEYTETMPIMIGDTLMPWDSREHREVNKSRNTYVVVIPKDAKFADSLQEKLDLYLEFAR